MHIEDMIVIVLTSDELHLDSPPLPDLTNVANMIFLQLYDVDHTTFIYNLTCSKADGLLIFVHNLALPYHKI